MNSRGALSPSFLFSLGGESSYVPLYERGRLARFLEDVILPTLTHPIEVILLSISSQGGGVRESKEVKPFWAGGYGKKDKTLKDGWCQGIHKMLE